jgi:Ca2+-binding EF-hand superfamily protein
MNRIPQGMQDLLAAVTDKQGGNIRDVPNSLEKKDDQPLDRNSVAELKKLFKEIDSDGSGEVDRTEFKVMAPMYKC